MMVVLSAMVQLVCGREQGEQPMTPHTTTMIDKINCCSNKAFILLGQSAHVLLENTCLTFLQGSHYCQTSAFDMYLASELQTSTVSPP